MNGYVAGGWGASAGMLALYTWRVLYRGRVLTRALPPQVPSTDSPEPDTFNADTFKDVGAEGHPADAPSAGEGAAGAGRAGEVRSWP